MSLFDAAAHRIRALFRSEAHASELDEEMRFHLSLDALQHGRPAPGPLVGADAALAARRRFGNVTYHKEETRRMAGLGFFDTARQDARFALRTFRRAPGFTAVAVLTLAIGIGANTAIFSAVDALLLRPLPFDDPSRLMKVSLVTPATASEPSDDDRPWSIPKFAVFRDAQTVFSDIALYQKTEFILTGSGDAERDVGEIVGAQYLPTLGIRPVLGRNFAHDEDDHPDGPKVILVSDALWSRRFNADPHPLGKTLDLNGKPYTVVGVLPPGFRGLSGSADLWIPIMSQDAETVTEPWNHGYIGIARLRPGVTATRATAVTRQLGARVDAAYPSPRVSTVHWGATATPLDDGRVDPTVRRSLFILLAAVGLVLLIACANVANLFLVRATGRRREIAVRLAVGASRARLVRQLLTESVLLSVLGGVASFGVASWGVKLLSALNPASALNAQRLSGLGVVDFASIRLDPEAFAFAASLALATGIVFGLVPALQATRPSLSGALKGDGAGIRRHGGEGMRFLSSRNVLAVLEITLSLVLLAGSGLMLRSLANLLRIEPGFSASHVLTLRLNPPPSYTADSLPGFYDRMLARLGSLPGARGAALADCPPLNGGCNGTAIEFHDRPPVPEGADPAIGVHWVTASWFGALGVPLLQGRMFASTDRKGTPKVVIINEAAARKFWPAQNPIGRPVGILQGGMDSATVIGVVGNVRFATIDSPAEPDAYISYYQSPRGRMMLFLPTSADPRAVAPAATRALHDLTPDLPVYDARPLAERVADSMGYERFSTVLLALFAAVALALAAMGTYGVISFGVAQRTREIGIRVALGATRRDVTRLIVGQGIGLAAVGGILGLGAAVAATRELGSLLYGVAPSDPATFLAITGLLTAAVVAASWIPARRAARIEPTEALRQG